MYDTDMCAQYLISGATDLIRQNARHGTTNLIKLAHLAEMHGTNVELNGPGGLYGLVHAHLLCCYTEHLLLRILCLAGGTIWMASRSG